jgi:RimJ/RimL family protein N-acetyltransferase
VPPIRARRRIYSEVEGLCFTYRQLPREFRVWRPELVRRLDVSAAPLIEALPTEAGFLFHHYGKPPKLLSEGLAFGVFQKGRLVSLATSLALTPRHCDVGVYTPPRFRNRGCATDCVEALFSCLFDRGIKPLWRIGVQQKVALYFAEKPKMDEIGTDGREVYLQACPSC